MIRIADFREYRIISVTDSASAALVMCPASGQLNQSVSFPSV